MAATLSVWQTVCAGAATALLATTLLADCSPKAATDAADIRVSAIPAQLPNLVQEQHHALIERVCGLAGLQCRWVPSGTYEALDHNMGSGEVDLAYFGGATFVQAALRHDAVPLVMLCRGQPCERDVGAGDRRASSPSSFGDSANSPGRF